MPVINAYRCLECNESIITRELLRGTTPMFISCRATPGCTGQMESRMYRVDQDQVANWEWYRPDARQKLSPGERAHVQKGGLLLRKVGEESEMEKAPRPANWYRGGV
jgi:hypothetical protein